MQWLSRGKFDRLPRSTAGSTFGVLDGCGLCCHWPACPNTACLTSRSCSSARAFDTRLFQTSHRESALALRHPFTPITVLHLQAIDHARHTKENGLEPGSRPFSNPLREKISEWTVYTFTKMITSVNS